MKKKTMAYLLIGIGLLAAVIYFVFGRKREEGASGDAAPALDPRGDLAADDDATYKKMVALLPGKDKGWVGGLFDTAYSTGLDQNAGNLPLVGGVVTKSAALQSVFFQSAPNDKGEYTITSNGKTFKSLWDDATYQKMWNLWAGFQNRHAL